MKRLNFGCGYDIREGWTNVDKVRHGNHDSHDILHDWPYSGYDEILANHVLHMFDYRELKVVLKRLHETLVPGGVLTVVDFDPLKAFQNYQAGDETALIIPDAVEKTLDGKFAAYLTWYGTRRSIETHMSMADKLKKAGFTVQIAHRDPPPGYGRKNESWIVVGTA